ncbi:MAG TPA: MarC family protein [Verrucomicrobiae bacterium]|nr:MarC family protein [Verrucomicrobiae bacterium]
MSVPDWIEKLLLAFIPLFVAIDPIGVVPLFWGISHGVPPERKRRIVHQATWTAALVAIGFMFLGKLIFRALNITVADFQVAGGLILLGLAAHDLLGVGPGMAQTSEDFGVVPLGLPIIVGPATLATLLIVMDSVGVVYALIGLVVNLVLINFSFRHSDQIAKIIGMPGLRAFSKITSLLLAAIAVAMIRRGWHAM